MIVQRGMRPVVVTATVMMLAGCAAQGSGPGVPSIEPTMAGPSATAPPSAPPSATPSPTAGPTGTPVPSIPTADVVYLALGDSNVYGAPRDCGGCVTYPHLVAERITADTGKSVALLDGTQHNRLTARGLLGEIKSDSWGEVPGYPVRTGGLSPRAAIAAADIITITVAANTIPWYQDPDSCGNVYGPECIADVEEPYIAAVDGFLAEINAIRDGKPTAVRITTFYNDLLKGPGYDPAWFEDAATIAQATTTAKTFLDRWNGDICTTAEKRSAVCIDLYHAVNGRDGDKPLPDGWYTKSYGDLNQGGHNRIAEEIAKVGFEPLWPAP